MDELANNEEHRLEEAVHSFLDAQSRGLEPDIDDFVKAYPDLASQIRQRILNLRRIDTLFDSLVQAEESDFDGLAPGQDLVGQTIGGFEVVEVIGRGGMGVVYLARDTNLDRSVAIKSLPPDQPGDPRSHTRFRREAKLLASLNHSNIAIIHEIIEQDDGSGYLILEYIPGETLARRIAREPIKPAQALAIGQQIAEAVAAAHEKGVIHRDLKPGNIKITPEGKVKVLDFGLAKAAVDEDSEKDITITQPGRVMGTPAYMSPEQARAKPTSHYTDIWSFGCILYEMLTGHLPFEGETATDVIAQIIERDPDWEALPQDTPSNIRVLLRRCLEKNPQQRIQHMADAVAEIRDTLNLSTTAPLLAMPVKSRRMTMVIGALTVLVLFGASLWFTFIKRASPSVDRIGIVVLPFDSQGLGGDAHFATGTTEGIRSRLSPIDSLRVICRTSAIQCKEAQMTIPQIGEALNVKYVLMGTVRWMPSPEGPTRVYATPELIRISDVSQVWSKSYEDALSTSLEMQSEVAEMVLQKLGVTLNDADQKAIQARPTDNAEAWTYYVRGNDYGLRGNVQGAIDMYEAAVALDDTFAEAHARLSKAHSRMYWFNHDRSDSRRELALNALERAVKLDPELPEAIWAQGWYHYWCLDEYGIALECFERAQKAKPHNGRFIAATAWAQRRMGRYPEALANFKKAYEADPLSQPITASLGGACTIMRQYEDAEEYLTRSIELAEASPGPYVAKAKLYLQWKGNIERARAVLEEASRNVPPKDQKKIRNLSIDIDMYEGDFKKAKERLDSMVQDVNNVRGITNALLYARIYRCMDDKGKEEAYSARARDTILEFAEKYWVSRTYKDYGMALAGLGDSEKAIDHGLKAVKLMSEAGNAREELRRLEDLARIYAVVGDLGKAMDIIEPLVENPSELSVQMLKIDPDWIPLHGYPRFEQLVKGK